MNYPFLSAVLLSISLAACNSNQTIEELATEQATEVEVSNVNKLVHAQWQLVQLNGQAAEKGEGGKPIFLRFNAEKSQANGFSGCNNYFGQYSADEQSLNFSHFAMTRKFCKNAMALEGRYAKAMATVAGYQFNESQLQLLDKQGSIVAEFSRD
ncbi:META domain-containing protein [Thalassotalea sp. M1531]|uniref:META domain-containing protein n=1 Tax=Thalassotalea algicola TaxID=2716224 RepID=A0A7Y0L9Q7_9GAMM|nr:META domain-containing protein [Thalassotalea algicola]NMP30564.1 META domain-containing protein [Thalassotalea algicola]